MKKDNNRRPNFNTNNTIYNQDILQEMNDDRLDALKNMLRGKISSLLRDDARKNEKEVLKLQTEHAYVTRELEIRVNRKKIHEEYVRKIRASRPQRPGRRRHNPNSQGQQRRPYNKG